MAEEKCPKGKKPETCTPEQIEECHGVAEKHPCKESKCGKKGADK